MTRQVFSTIEYNNLMARLRFLHELHRVCLADFKEYSQLPTPSFDLNKFNQLNKSLEEEICSIIAQINIQLNGRN